jgi:polyphosphate kinase 2 (PPK2 family)
MGFCSGEQVDKFLTGVPVFEKVMVESGIILIKYWLEVSAEEQTRRLQDRINDGRKLWKLSPMDLAPYTRWDDHQARDDMFQASDTAWHRGSWPSNDKRRARLVDHQPSAQPYSLQGYHPRCEGKLPKRGKIGKYKAVAYPFKVVEERF